MIIQKLEKINKNTPLKKGDFLYFERKGNRFDDSFVKCVGIVRDYNNKNGFSGCCDRVYTIFNISGIIKENENWFFCWYKSSFLLLSEKAEDKNRNGNLTENNMIDEIGINVYKLSEEEKEKTLLFINNMKILENLK